ncbi:hypothetical protein [Neisseria musculi]|uniref:hypothetical protein n=1 Tax=Neisseria musculi TaxID=1815583 RepID=UPI001BE426DB|nr:hypothetical protein [Neisseria musculi]
MKQHSGWLNICYRVCLLLGLSLQMGGLALQLKHGIQRGITCRKMPEKQRNMAEKPDALAKFIQAV